ncbi:MAG: DUF881 domain-containing protein [Actinomycetota bacterium]|nr:DUF881 domain-containing protein [Actinomycetota bacterium]
MSDPTKGPDREPESPANSAPGHASEPSGARRRLLAALRRPSRSQLMGGLLVGVLGFATVTQVKSNQQGDIYAGLRSADLIQVLNGLNAEARRADQELVNLERTRSQLSNKSQARQAAIQQARGEANTLGILAGTLPAQGPGIRITVTDPKGTVSLNNLLDGLEELRAAGAEAMEFNDSVRVVAQTSVEHGTHGLLVDGKQITAPYVIDAIGDPATLAAALDFLGGFTFDVKANKGDVKVQKTNLVKITAVVPPEAPRYAAPPSGQ